MPKKPLRAVNERGRRIGEDHPGAKLTDHEVELLLALHEQGWGYRRLARKFGIDRGHARRLCLYLQRGQGPVKFK